MVGSPFRGGAQNRAVLATAAKLLPQAGITPIS